MVEEGALENPVVDRILALHVWPMLRAGQVGVTPGPALASVDDFGWRRALQAEDARVHDLWNRLRAAWTSGQA